MDFFLSISLIIYLAYIIYIIAGLFQFEDIKQSNLKEKTVSVVIAARNEQKNIGHLLEDLIKQDYPAHLIDIAIVDDRSTDGTWDIIQSFSEMNDHFVGIQVFEYSDEMTPKKNALSKAIEATKGEIILTTDADCRVPSTWISSMVQSIGNEYSLSIGYSHVNDSSESFFHQYQKLDFLGIMSSNAGAAGLNNFWSGSGQNLAYLRSAFEEIDGFNPVHYLVSGDDMYLVQAISKIGKTTFNTESDGAVQTQPVNTLDQFINQRSRWASNSRRISDGTTSFFIFLLSAFFSNVFLLISFLFGVGSFLTIFLIKFIFEGAVLTLGSRLFKTPIRLPVYIVWAIVQPIYIPTIAIMGLNDKFNWKP